MWNFLTEINANGTTIILTTHYLEEAEQMCRNIAIIDEGEIIENTSMKKLIGELDSQVFILDTANEMNGKPEITIDDVLIHRIDSHSLEVKVPNGKLINEVFKELDKQGLEISSMRNKTNRLEQLFLSRLRNNGND